MSVIAGFLFLVPAVHAYETDPVELHFGDQVTVMEGAAYETGWLPSDSSPVALNFALESSQIADVDMDAIAKLTWPEALTLSITGVPGTGWVDILGSLSSVISLKIDLWGYKGDWELDRRTLDVQLNGGFDPLLLPNDAPPTVEISNSGAELNVITLDYSPITAVTAYLYVDLATSIQTTMAGLRIENDDGSVISTEDGTALLPVPTSGAVALASTYISLWVSSMDLMIIPSIEVCVDIMGCYELASFQIPVDMSDVSIEDPFEPLSYGFSLPYLQAPEPSHDFGDVEIGHIVNFDLALGNTGATELLGSAGISGSPYFSVYPDTVFASSETEDGLVVSFLPETAGPVTGTLLLATNDPVNPIFEITLYGNGYEPDLGADMTSIPAEVGGCGCANGGGGQAGLLTLLLAPLMVRRRSPRRRSAR